ncbi:MAG: 5'/3'-nucleotidase SurE [Planctomycetota bacterium]|jgi:5'-nucleotidase
MRILVTNDDGINAPGLVALERAAQRVGGEVYVVAPMRQHSAQSHAITIHKPVFISELPHSHGEVMRVAVDGTPCDCVRIALLKLMADNPPDLVLSGINHGGNLGWNIFFSGTVAAASEGHSFGIPSIAFSLANWNSDINFAGLDLVAADVIERLLKAQHSRADWLYNINFPACETEQIKGVKMVRQNPVLKGDNFEERKSPDGRRYFWPVWDEVKAKSAELKNEEWDTWAVQENYISLTPLKYEVSHMDEPLLMKSFED